jgi:hypothetical protein
MHPDPDTLRHDPHTVRHDPNAPHHSPMRPVTMRHAESRTPVEPARSAKVALIRPAARTTRAAISSASSGLGNRYDGP